MRWDTPLAQVTWDRGEVSSPRPELVDWVRSWAARRHSAVPVEGCAVPVGFDTEVSAWATISCALEALYGPADVDFPPAPAPIYRPIDGAIY
jgi:hypothetical protein